MRQTGTAGRPWYDAQVSLEDLVGCLTDFGLLKVGPTALGFVTQVMEIEQDKPVIFEGPKGFNLQLGIASRQDPGPPRYDVICEICETDPKGSALTFARRSDRHVWRVVSKNLTSDTQSPLRELAVMAGMRLHDGSAEIESQDVFLSTLKRLVGILSTGA